MATVPAAPARRSARPDPTRRLWQVPAFLVGLAAFLAAWQGWLPIGNADSATVFLRDLAALRGAGERLSPDTNDLKALLDRVAKAAPSFREHEPAAHFALGSGYVRLAEVTVDPDEAASWWELARQHFAGVKPEQLPDAADQPRLAYRAAKARAALLPANTPPAEIDLIRNLLICTPTGEEAGEGPRLAAELSLRMNPPDLARARMCLIAYIGEAGLGTPPAAIARARLRLSELHLMCGEPDAARKLLEQIRADAPPDVLAPAKAQLARILMSQRDYEGAIRELTQLRAMSGAPPGLRPLAAYTLGVCLLLTNPPDKAAAAGLFEEAAKSDGLEGPAAEVKLAGLHLQTPEPGKHREAATLLMKAVKKVPAVADYTNPYLPVSEVQATFELAVQTLLADGAFEAAFKTAEAYGSVAPAGRDREKRAEVLAAWGTSLPKGGADARVKFAAAADEYVALATARTAATDKADLFRRAAGMYRQAGDPSASIATLEKLLKMTGLGDDVTGPVWVEYAESLLVANRPNEVMPAFNKAMASGGPVSTATRYRLARQFLDSRHAGLAPIGLALLQQIAEAERVGPAEQEVHERALVELAHEHIRAGRFEDAEARLRTQLSRYPTGPEAGLGKLLLAISLLQRAPPLPANSKVPEHPKAAGWRDEALSLCRQIVKDVDAKKQAAGKLAERDPWLRLQACLRILQAYQYMGKPYEVIAEAAPLLRDYKGTVEELIVLSTIYHAHKQLNKDELALKVRDQMREVFTKLKDQPGAFRAAAGEYSRDYWEKTWFTP